MMEIINVPGDDKRYVITNKGKIILVTYNRKYAEFLASILKKKDWAMSSELAVSGRRRISN